MKRTPGRGGTSPYSNNGRNVGMSPKPTSEPQNLVWPMLDTIGRGPLESVMEGDAETDGATTPGSFLQSPLVTGRSQRSKSRGTSTGKSNQKQKRTQFFKSPVTPTPPSMDGLSLSASTSHLLQTIHSEDNGDHFETAASPTSLSSRSKSASAFQQHGRSFHRDAHHQQQQQEKHNYQRSFESEFRDEDDMITLDTQSTIAKNTSPIRHHHKTRAPEEDERSNSFFARMEGVLDRVEEQIMEDQSPRHSRYREEPSRPSDEIKASLPVHPRRSHLSQKSQTSRQERQYHTSHQTQQEAPSGDASSDDEQWTNQTDFDDDSTNVIATQVAERRVPKDWSQQKSAFASTKDFKRPHPLNVLQQRPTQIVIDTAIPSPAHTNITMDATMMNETYTSFMGFDEDNNDHSTIHNTARAFADDPNYDLDNLSTVTPVLDRYRLDPDDDNSVGVKVVPNQRRPHLRTSNVKTKKKTAFAVESETTKTQPKEKTPSLLKSSSRPNTPKQTMSLPSFTANDFLSPKASSISKFDRTPTNLSPRNRKVYRKTPFAKRRPNFDDNDGNLSTWNENDNPNVSTGSSVAASPEKFLSSAMGSMSISVPPLRPRSLGTRAKERTPAFSKAQSSSFSAFESDKSGGKNDEEESATIDHNIDKTIERIDQELAAGTKRQTTKADQSSGRIDPVGKSFLNQVKSMPKIEKSQKQHSPKKVSPGEFNAAPNVIREKVSLDEINDALDLLSQYGVFGTT
ncbi:MAG: hypothetical protein SGILL_009416, partial [Bacillariaceae sp.]